MPVRIRPPLYQCVVAACGTTMYEPDKVCDKHIKPIYDAKQVERLIKDALLSPKGDIQSRP